MNEAVDNHLQRSIFWAETGNDISVNCELVAIRPFIPFLVKSNISGLSPFRGFGDFLGGRNRYDYHAKYHKSCLKAYFKGDPELLDKPVVRDTLESYIGFLHHENVNPVPSKSLRKETGLAQLFQMRPESAMDVFCLYRHCRFQTAQKPLEMFGEELPIPLYAEINYDHGISEFEEENRTRQWAFIPKRLIDGTQTHTIQANGDEHTYAIAKIGDGDGELEQANCFWLTGHRDTTHLFENAELVDLIRNPLECSEISYVKYFAENLNSLLRPSIEDIERMEQTIRKLKMAISLMNGSVTPEDAEDAQSYDEYEYDDFLPPCLLEASTPRSNRSSSSSSMASGAGQRDGQQSSSNVSSAFASEQDNDIKGRESSSFGRATDVSEQNGGGNSYESLSIDNSSNLLEQQDGVHGNALSNDIEQNVGGDVHESLSINNSSIVGVDGLESPSSRGNVFNGFERYDAGMQSLSSDASGEATEQHTDSSSDESIEVKVILHPIDSMKNVTERHGRIVIKDRSNGHESISVNNSSNDAEQHVNVHGRESPSFSGNVTIASAQNDGGNGHQSISVNISSNDAEQHDSVHSREPSSSIGNVNVASKQNDGTIEHESKSVNTSSNDAEHHDNIHGRESPSSSGNVTIASAQNDGGNGHESISVYTSSNVAEQPDSVHSRDPSSSIGNVTVASEQNDGTNEHESKSANTSSNDAEHHDNVHGRESPSSSGNVTIASAQNDGGNGHESISVYTSSNVAEQPDSVHGREPSSSSNEANASEQNDGSNGHESNVAAKHDSISGYESFEIEISIVPRELKYDSSQEQNDEQVSRMVTRRTRTKPDRLKYYRRSHEKFILGEMKKRQVDMEKRRNWMATKSRRYSSIRH